MPEWKPKVDGLSLEEQLVLSTAATKALTSAKTEWARHRARWLIQVLGAVDLTGQ